MKRLFTTFFLLTLVCVMAGAKQMVPVFQEGFSRAQSVIIQGGYFSENFYFQPADHPDNEGWTSLNAYESERAVKFSAKTKTGTATSPAITFSKDVAETVKVRLRVQTWRGDNVDVHVEFVGVEGAKQTIDADLYSCISNRDEDPIELTFTNIPSGSQLKFSATAKAGGNGVTRFFLSDIVVFEEVETETTPVLLPVTFYQHFADLMVSEEGEVKTVKVETANLPGQISYALPEGSEYEVVSADFSDPACAVFKIKFVPRNAGYKEEVLTLTCGDLKQQVVLVGTARVYRPTVQEPAQVSDTAFTAQWTQPGGCEEFEVVVYSKEEKQLVAPDLMFSKYIEGKSNNRALEIYNGTGAPVSLKGYVMRMETNGAGGLTASEYQLPDLTVAEEGTFTICNAQFAALRDIANKTIGFQDGGYDNIMTFTGDDAIALFNPAGEVIDLLGYESIDVTPAMNSDWGTDVSLYRKPECYQPHRKFYPEEWERHEMDYVEGYGEHLMASKGLVRNIVERARVSGDLRSYEVKNLTPGVKYYYAVKGLSNGMETHYSAEQAQYPAQNSVEAVSAPLSYTLQGNTLVLSEAATVTALDGTQLQGHDGVYTLPARGIYVARSAAGTAKIVY